MQPSLMLSGVRKTYRNGTEAVRGVNLHVWPNEIFCVVGPNGAGKTTLLRMIGTQLEPTAGTIYILGVDAVESAPLARSHLAVVPQEASVDHDLSAFEQVYYYLRVRGLSRGEARAKADEALELVGLSEYRRKVAGTLSGGLRRRILLAMIIATGASVMLLDEPTTGLDPVARRRIWSDLNALKTGRTVLLTTHSMEEAEAIADRVAIFACGNVVAMGTVAQLRDKLASRHKICIENGHHHDALKRFGRTEECGGKVVLYPECDRLITEVVAFAVAENLPVSVLPTNLEDVYLQFVGDVS